MATCRDIITSAMRKLRQLPSGDSASADEADDGLTALQAMYLSWVGQGLFGRLTDVIKDAAYTAEEWERVRKDAAVTITIPDTITDDATGDERAPYDLALIEVIYPTDGTRQISLYDANLGVWVRLDSLTLDSDAPLSGRGEHGLACALATYWADEFGIELVGPATARSATNFRLQLSYKVGVQRRSNQAVYY